MASFGCAKAPKRFALRLVRIIPVWHKATLAACFAGYVCQAIVNNFAPLLFVTFQSEFGIPLSEITLLVTVNFAVQLIVDIVSAKLVDRIGYRAAGIVAHVMMGAGFLMMGTLLSPSTTISRDCSRPSSFTRWAADWWKSC